MKNLNEVEQLTLYEFELLMKAYQLTRLDREHDIYLQAYLNFVATSMKQVGKKSVPVYPTFDKFFNYKQRENELLNTTKERKNNLSRLIVKANSLGKGVSE